MNPAIGSRWAFFLILVVAPAWAIDPVPAGSSLAGIKQATDQQLVLRAGIFDPLTQQLDNKTLDLPRISGGRHGVVQFHGPADSGVLEEAGIQVLAYIPHNAFLVRWQESDAELAGKLPGVRHAGPFQPAWKVAPIFWSPGAKARLPDALEVFGYRGDSARALAMTLKKLDPEIHIISADAPSGFPLVRARLGSVDAGTLARRLAVVDGVMFVDQFQPQRIRNADSVGPIQGNDASGGDPPTVTPIWDQDLIGTGQIVAVADSGLDRNGPHFSRYDTGNGPVQTIVTDAEELDADQVGTIFPERKVVGYFVQPGATAYDNSEDCGGVNTAFHGTHVTGTVAADGGDTSSSTEPAYDDGDGMAPHAQILFQDLGDDVSGCLEGRGGYPMFTQARNAGAGIASGSYGSLIEEASNNGYTGNDFEADAASYDLEDILLVFAGGNAGDLGPGHVDHPGQAKSSLSVAASGHGNISNIASFSSIGPAHDGRIKPDIAAPGVAIRSVTGNSNNDNPPTQGGTPTIFQKSGTSMATPTVSGGAALMRQYFMDGFYPTGQRNAEDTLKPTGALMKATLLNGTRLYLNTPADDSGWGRIWLDNNLYFVGDDRQLRIWDLENLNGLQTGEFHEYTVQVPAGAAFRATLVWFDPPGTSFSGPALVNDLDLRVTTPGATFRGNNFNNGSSVGGGSFDGLNTVEQVAMTSPAAGEYTVRVNAASVPGNGAQNTDRQGYALVVSSAQCDTGVSGSSGVDLSGDDAGIQVDFDAISGAGSYQVYRALGSCASADPGTFRFLGSTDTPGFVDRRTQGGFEYAYQVRGVDACGEGPAGDCKSFVSTAACTLVPSFDSASVKIDIAGGSQCGTTLNWTAGTTQCPGLDLKYNVYRSIDPFFVPDTGNLIATGLSATSYTDLDVDSLTTYYYVVKAEDSGTAGIGPNGGNETGAVVRYRQTTRADTSSPGDYRDDPDGVSFASLEPPWQVTSRRAGTGQFSYHNARDGEDHPNLTCAYLTTAPMTLQSGSPELSYQAWYNLEIDWDGVVVQISNDGGANWQDLPPDGGYPGDFSMTLIDGVPINECGFPPTQGAFNGEHEFFETMTSDLSDFAGETVQIRWAFSSDPGLEFEGFYLDDITVSQASTPDACKVGGVSSKVSGPWFNAAQSGHGWFIEALESDLVNAYWYVYNDGAPVWLVGTGPVSGSSAELPMFITSGTDFLPDFNAADVMASPWGTLTFEFDSDTTGTASWEPVIDGFDAGSLAMSQLAPLLDNEDACHSGSYYNPDQNGHGFVAQVLQIEGVTNVLLAWYVYQDGEQVWLLGTGPLVGDTAEVAMQVFSGADFPPDFASGDVVSPAWGTVTFEFTGNDTAQASWTSSIAGYPDGNVDLIRLTQLSGHICQ